MDSTGATRQADDRSHRAGTALLLRVLRAFPSLPAGEAFFPACTAQMAALYGAQYALIGTFEGPERQRVTTRAVWSLDGPGDNFTYDLAGSPCQDVLDARVAMIPSGVAQRYPQDRALAEYGIEAYIGAPLQDASGRVRGVAVVMFTAPQAANRWLGTVLRLYANRAACVLEQMDVEAGLRQAESDYRAIFESVPIGVYRSSPEGYMLRANPALAAINGYASEAELLASVRDIATEWYVDPERRTQFMQLMSTQGYVNGFISEIQRHGRQEDRLWVNETARAVRGADGSIRFYEGSVQDITAQMRAEMALRASEARFRALVEKAQGIIMVLSPDGRIDYLSPGFARILGREPDEWLGRNIFELIHPEDADRVRADTAAVLEGSNSGEESQYRLQHADGGWRVVAALGKNALNDPHVGGLVVNLRDITEWYEADRRLREMALTDGLTGLPNRNLLRTRAEEALTAAKRSGGQFGLLFVDLDRFKPVNDSLGHIAGDRLLRAVGERLAGAVRKRDMVARLGGDEFAVLLSQVEDDRDAAAVARKITWLLAKPFQIGSEQLTVSASVGISCYPRDGTGFDELLKRADLAMYQAKSDGRNRYCFFSNALQDRALARHRLANQLRQALHGNEFELLYQPQVSLDSGQINGAEALLRWRHPELGLLPPDRFIALAEETGAIHDLGRWVLRTACRQLRDWRALGERLPRLAVNISTQQLRDPQFPTWLAQLLADMAVDPTDLELEITESAMMHDGDQAPDMLRELKGMGLTLAIDDFGTGHSALSYVKRFPVDCLKIDRMFILGLPDDGNDVAITRAIIALAGSLGLRLVAEGVETDGQCAFLREEGCGEAQGYLFSRPVSAAEMITLLRGADEHGSRQMNLQLVS